MTAKIEYKYDDMIHRCFRCGYCKFPTDWSTITNCPTYARYRLESFSAGGRLWLIRAWVMGEMEWTDRLAKIVYSCTNCKNCEEKCPISFSDNLVNMVVAARNAMVDQGSIPSPVKDFLNNVHLHGNPYGLSAKKRDQWIEDSNIAPYTNQEYLFYVGCEGSYDTRAQTAARALANLLLKAGVSFGVLGNQEISDGNEVEMLGEEGLLEELAEKNIRQFKELGVKKIITFSPHSYNVFQNSYPKYGGDFEVFHYTQILPELMQAGKLEAPADLNMKVTYHDPCFLGRWNKQYDMPRKLLKSLNGVELTEMERNKKSALCCGGGGGNFYTDFLGGSEDSPARIRVREAHDTGANVLAVACPNCLTMLEDAVKVEGLEEKLAVRDIAEILNGTVTT
ncbi:MAG: (Fe-S)-binding protein [Deltaproteobacteria bacterium]|jgi:Fe-S oxidoreductase|nr:(Fe-S)-binding protein [Deltaproteobacteria bacterium]MBT4641976.1 (Fe-S)-binding protein [Deltaproteobacteria bacterium]MBT6498853.1 (Fe-S)-binding protein [Deltaproteobacteria bacterium]MBT7153461.1 (Fe-S)-binding protein [Deltaproteobacteria bacterium]